MKIQSGIRRFHFNPFETSKPKSGGGGGGGDISLLLNFNEANGTSTFLDESGYNWTVSDPNGLAIANNTIITPKFGTNSLQVRATEGPYIPKALLSGGQFTFDGPFTIAGWMYSDASTPNPNMRPIISNKSTGISDLVSFAYLTGAYGGFSLRFALIMGSFTPFLFESSGGSTYGDEWAHFILTRGEDGILSIGVQGHWNAKVEYTGTIDFSGLSSANTSGLSIGSSGWSPGSNAMFGNIDNLIVIKGRSIYDTTGTTYPVPTSPYTTST